MKRSFRFLKISIAVILLGLSLWAMLLPPYFPSSSHALVNTRKITISSRVDGVISELHVTGRSMLAKGQLVAFVERDQSTIRREIESLGFLRKRIETQITNTDSQLANNQIQLKKSTRQYAERQAKTIEALEGALGNLEENAAIEQKQLEALQDSERGVRTLLDKGIVTRVKWLELNKLSIESEKRLHSIRSNAEDVSTRLELARSGLQMAQSENSDALTADITALQREFRDLTAAKADLNVQLRETIDLSETSTAHLKDTRQTRIDSPSDGMTWACPVVEGQSVSTGQSLIHLAHSRSIFVESFFHRYYEGSILPGDHAFVQLRGEAGLRTGRVAEVQVQENGSDDLYVINSVTPSSSMLRVIVELDDKNLPIDELGKLGKVVVTSGEAGAVNRTLVWLSLMLRSSQ